jgi:hypothetical protein
MVIHGFEDVDARDKSAFTRVLRRAMRGHDASRGAITPESLADALRAGRRGRRINDVGLVGHLRPFFRQLEPGFFLDRIARILREPAALLGVLSKGISPAAHQPVPKYRPAIREPERGSSGSRINNSLALGHRRPGPEQAVSHADLPVPRGLTPQRPVPSFRAILQPRRSPSAPERAP